MKIKKAIKIMPNRYKVKPIFTEEKEFIESHLPQIAPIPDGCWIGGGSTKTVFADLYSSEYLFKFKVENGGKFILLKDNRSLFENYTPVSLKDTIEYEKERINDLYDKCIHRLTDYVKDKPDKIYKINHSGGKDSELVMSVWNDMLKILDFTPDYEFVFLNTANEVADVYKRIKQIPNIKIINPQIGWKQWIEKSDYAFPSIFRRNCCSVYKEGQAKKAFDIDADIVQVLGVRKFESTKRSKYDFIMGNEFKVDLFKKNIHPKKWIELAPIIDLQNIDVWLLLFLKKIPINRRYRLGCNRVGCLICPYSSAYDDEITKTYYSHQYEWFVKAIEQNYDRHGAKRLGWTMQEWVNGAWKCPKCKNTDLLRSEPTDDNVKLYAQLKGLSENMARKYFNRTCGNCGRKMVENEIAMFYKLCGRFENTTDNREVLCKKCLCKQLNMTTKEYSQKNIDFIEQGCNLF